jgi:hypothetical protein
MSELWYCFGCRAAALASAAPWPLGNLFRQLSLRGAHSKGDQQPDGRVGHNQTIAFPRKNIFGKTHIPYKAALDLVWMSKDKDKHVLLVELEAGSEITRALLVKLMRTKKTLMKVHCQVDCQFVGSVYFHPPQEHGEENERWIEVAEVRIGGSEEMEEIEKKSLGLYERGEKCNRQAQSPRKR